MVSRSASQLPVPGLACQYRDRVGRSWPGYSTASGGATPVIHQAKILQTARNLVVLRERSLELDPMRRPSPVILDRVLGSQSVATAVGRTPAPDPGRRANRPELLSKNYQARRPVVTCGPI